MGVLRRCLIHVKGWRASGARRVRAGLEGEGRFVAIGRGSAGELLVAVYALRGLAIRLICVRRATGCEAKCYEG